MPALPVQCSEHSPSSLLERIFHPNQILASAERAVSQISRTAKTKLVARQNVVAIPEVYAGLNSGPSPGAVAGIVLGSVAGFLLLIWLLWILSNGTGFIRTSVVVGDEEVITRRETRKRRSRRPPAPRSRSPQVQQRDRIIRTERIVRDRSIPPPMRESSRVREILVETTMPERRVENDDIIEVLEEHSSVDVPAPKRKSRRSSGYRSVDRYSSAQEDEFYEG